MDDEKKAQMMTALYLIMALIFVWFAYSEYSGKWLTFPQKTEAATIEQPEEEGQDNG